MSRAIRSLHFAVRPRVALKYTAQAMALVAVAACPPALVCWLTGATDAAWRYSATIVLLGAFGVLFGRMPVRNNLQRNEALVVLALTFALASVAMAIPLAGFGLSLDEGLFEAISGITTTGLSTLPSVSDRPLAFLFARAWLQWVGGLGILVLMLALILEPGIAAQRLGFGERVDIVGGTRSHARRVLMVYCGLTAIGILALLGCGERPFDAIVHTLTAVSTGGFSNYDESIGGLSPAACWATTALSFAGAISFSVYYLGFSRHFASLARDPQIRGLLLMTLGTAATLYLVLALGPGEAPQSMHFDDVVLLAVSAQTTTGFSTVPVVELDAAAKLVLIAAMFVGGEIGSTAGGIKVFRLIILVGVAVYLIRRTAIPQSARAVVTASGEVVGRRELETVVAIVCCYVAVVLASWLVFLVYGVEPMNALFEVVSAVATTGLSAGVTGPGLPLALQAVLCADMVLGRVEMLALLVAVSPNTWMGRRRRSS